MLTENRDRTEYVNQLVNIMVYRMSLALTQGGKPQLDIGMWFFFDLRDCLYAPGEVWVCGEIARNLPSRAVLPGHVALTDRAMFCTWAMLRLQLFQ